MDNKKKKKSPYEPISKEEKTVNMVLDMFKRSEQAKAPYVELWKKCLDAYKGEMDKTAKPDYKSDNVSNYIFSTCETIRPIMVSENPKFQVMPRLEKDFNKSYIGEESHLSGGNIKDIKVTGTTLIRIKDKEISSSYENSEDITKKLKELVG